MLYCFQQFGPMSASGSTFALTCNHMVAYAPVVDQDDATLVFQALADPTRRRIVELLTTEESLCVNDLASRFSMTRQAVTKHLNCLCDAGIVSTRRLGRERVATLRESGMGPARRWLDRYDRFWDQRLQDLKNIVEGRGKELP